mgnify:FL=1
MDGWSRGNVDDWSKLYQQSSPRIWCNISSVSAGYLCTMNMDSPTPNQKPLEVSLSKPTLVEAIKRCDEVAVEMYEAYKRMRKE